MIHLTLAEYGALVSTVTAVVLIVCVLWVYLDNRHAKEQMEDVLRSAVRDELRGEQ